MTPDSSRARHSTSMVASTCSDRATRAVPPASAFLPRSRGCRSIPPRLLRGRPDDATHLSIRGGDARTRRWSVGYWSLVGLFLRHARFSGNIQPRQRASRHSTAPTSVEMRRPVCGCAIQMPFFAPTVDRHCDLLAPISLEESAWTGSHLGHRQSGQHRQHLIQRRLVDVHAEQTAGGTGRIAHRGAD